jgi:hypothetical protein
MDRNPVQYASVAPRYQGSGRAKNDLSTAHEFRVGEPQDSAQAVLLRSMPLQRSYLRDLSTHSRYCSFECYAGRAGTIDVVSAVFDRAWRD